MTQKLRTNHNNSKQQLDVQGATTDDSTYAKSTEAAVKEYHRQRSPYLPADRGNSNSLSRLEDGVENAQPLTPGTRHRMNSGRDATTTDKHQPPTERVPGERQGLSEHPLSQERPPGSTPSHPLRLQHQTYNATPHQGHNMTPHPTCNMTSYHHTI